MKFLIFVGSPRQQGNGYKLSKELEVILKDRGIEADFIYSKTLNNSCTHCGWCSCNDNKGCTIKDEYEPYIKNFHSYVGFVIITPIYFFGFPAQTKAFIDRLGWAEWSNKKLVLVTTSGSRGRYGGNDILVESLIRSCEYTGGEFIGYYNKVTRDKILPITKTDISRLTRLVIKSIK